MVSRLILLRIEILRGSAGSGAVGNFPTVDANPSRWCHGVCYGKSEFDGRKEFGRIELERTIKFPRFPLELERLRLSRESRPSRESLRLWPWLGPRFFEFHYCWMKLEWYPSSYRFTFLLLRFVPNVTTVVSILLIFLKHLPSWILPLITTFITVLLNNII